MCYGGAVRSQYARARVLSIDTSEAEALPGVLCVATQKDIPGKVNVGHLKKDQPTLIGVGELVHYLGDSVALICAVDQETEEAAKKLVTALLKAISLLMDNPYMGAALAEKFEITTDVRYFVVSKQLIFYHVDEESGTIEILRVLDGRTDYLSVLFG